MFQDNTNAQQRIWHDSAHASLCALGAYLCRIGFFRPVEQRVHLSQKVLKYSPIQKLEMFFVGLRAFAKAVSHTATTVRIDPALIASFGLPGCAEQSVIAATLNAATEQDVADLQAALGEIYGCYGQARRHPFKREFLVLDVDLSPLPASKRAEGSERGYMGRYRSKTGRKLVRVRAADTQETIWETVASGRTAESLPVLQEAIQAAEHLLGLEGIITWLLERGYQVTGKFKSSGRVRKLVGAVTTWYPNSSPGREVAPVPKPVTFMRPLQQYAVRTPSKEHEHGYYHAVVFTSRTDLSMTGVVEQYDGRAGMEADLKSDKHGLALAVIRKQRWAAQKVIVLLIQLAHNVLLWARQWLAKNVPRLNQYGIVRFIQVV